MNSAYIHILYNNINPFSYPTYSLFHFREIEALKLANFDLNLRGENVELWKIYLENGKNIIFGLSENQNRFSLALFNLELRLF